jgi:nicotinamidase/pyrazinamidase
MDILVVVDMQNDFIDGALGTPEARAIVPAVVERMRTFDGPVLCTRDTHGPDYLSTQEGKLLPVVHCVKDTPGWQLNEQVAAELRTDPIDKPSFGSLELMDVLRSCSGGEPPESITFCGLCTDICVISNALIAKAAFPETSVIVDSSCSAGVTPESHVRALEAMGPCQVQVI